MMLFLSHEITTNHNSFTFDKEESRHIVKVLRKKTNDPIYITDGKGYLYHAVIQVAEEKKCTVNINQIVLQPKNRSYYLHIAIAPTKLNERFEWFLEKATEIGIDEITPIICSNSERKVLKTDRMKKIIQSAVKQSNQFYEPILNEAIPFHEWMVLPNSGLMLIAHCEENMPKTHLKTIISNQPKVTLMIGPEGDFSPKEIKQALTQGYQAVSLGENRLRTETAGVYACTTLTIV